MHSGEPICERSPLEYNGPYIGISLSWPYARACVWLYVVIPSIFYIAVCIVSAKRATTFSFQRHDVHPRPCDIFSYHARSMLVLSRRSLHVFFGLTWLIRLSVNIFGNENLSSSPLSSDIYIYVCCDAHDLLLEDPCGAF